jgi:hypothetical protein
MWSFQRMKRLYPLKPQVKKGRDPLPLRVPQYAGTPGWMLLTHNQDSEPVAIFVDASDKPQVIPMIMDERLFSDTVIRVNRLSNHVFLACDLRYVNGANVFDKLNYSQRRLKLEALLDIFHSTDITALLTYDEIPHDTPIRGWETYDDMPGTLGVFLPADE